MSNKSKKLNRASLDLTHFQEQVLDPYLKGEGGKAVDTNPLAARSIIPPATAKQRSFAFIGTEIPRFTAENCVACMECVIACPDVAIHSRTASDEELDTALNQVDNSELKDGLRSQFARTKKHGAVMERQGKVQGQFSIWIDPDRCKSCGLCVEVCGDHDALAMQEKTPHILNTYRQAKQFIDERLSDSPHYYINDKLEGDIFMDETLRVDCGGSGACMGCGEVTAINMALTETAAQCGRNMAIVASTGCNTVYSSTYPYNIFTVPWTNSLFENAPTMAMGVRMRLDQEGRHDTKLWVFGGDGAMYDIGFQSLSRLLTSGMDINILVLDTQAYSNTGGQASTATFMGQNAKMSAHGKSVLGKSERRKELGLIAMQHPDVFVAQISPSNINHFLKAVKDALSFRGPSLCIAYTACIPENGIADNAANQQAQAAVTSRAFPLFVYDPRKGDSFKKRLSLQGNPGIREDWVIDRKTGESQDFTWFARSEGRFAKHFDKNGKPSETLLKSQEDRLKNWRTLRELARLL